MKNPSKTIKRTVKISPTVMKKAGGLQSELSYWSNRDRSGIVVDEPFNAPFSGEFVLHTKERSGIARDSLYCTSTLPFGLWKAYRSRLHETIASAALTQELKAALDLLGWHNYLALTPLPCISATTSRAVPLQSRDPAKVTASALIVAATATSEPGQMLDLLTAAAKCVEDRRVFLDSFVASSWRSHILWVETTIKDQTRLMRQICSKLQGHSDFRVAQFEISPLLDQITLKPWIYFKHYVRYICRRDSDWSPEPDLCQRLISAISLESSHSDLRHIVNQAEQAKTPDQRVAAAKGLRQRIDWLTNLKLPLGYSGSPNCPGLQQRLITSLVRLELRLIAEASRADEYPRAWPSFKSAQSVDANQLRRDLRYRPAPKLVTTSQPNRQTADNTTMWFG